MEDIKDGIKRILEIFLFVPVYLTLAAGPLVYYLKNIESPSSFLLNFSMITFTVGMFSLFIEDNREEFSFEKVGSMYLLSGSLALTLLFVTPFIKNSSSSLLNGTIGAVSHQIGELFLGLVFLVSIIGFSVSFGYATTQIIKPTFHEFVLGLLNRE